MRKINIFQLHDGYLDVVITQSEDIERDYFKKHVVELIPYSQIRDEIKWWSHHNAGWNRSANESWYPERESYNFIDFSKHFPLYLDCGSGWFFVLERHALGVRVSLSEGVFIGL